MIDSTYLGTEREQCKLFLLKMYCWRLMNQSMQTVLRCMTNSTDLTEDQLADLVNYLFKNEHYQFLAILVLISII